jgi:hypothetical protein
VGIVALGAAFGTGCLLPQEDAIHNTLILKNRPPRILEETAKLNNEPLRRVLTWGNDPGCRLEFEAFVEDPDIDDPVRFRWYVDYEPGTPDAGSSDRQLPIDEGERASSGEALRTPSVSLVVQTQNNAKFGPGDHVVTLMAFDGYLAAFEGPGIMPEPDVVPGSSAKNPRYSTTFDWFVTIQNGPCPPP